MKIIAFSPFKHLEYVNKVLSTPISASTGGLIAIDSSGEPKGVVLLDNWADNSVMGHIAIQHPMAMRNLPFEALKYVFLTCNKGIFLGAIPADNSESFKFHKHLGFSEMHRIEDGYALGIDIILMQMRREDCRYIKKLQEVA